jgi:hypothetical protein
MLVIPNVIHNCRPILTLIRHFRGKRAISVITDYPSRWGRFLLFHSMSPNRCSPRAPGERHMPIRLVVANSETSYLAIDAGILINAFEAAQ